MFNPLYNCPIVPYDNYEYLIDECAGGIKLVRYMEVNDTQLRAST